MTDLECFGERLKELRTDAGLTQRQLAEKLNVSTATVTSYEKSQKMPALDSALNVARLFSVSLDWLCGNAEAKSKEDRFNTRGDIARALDALLRIGVFQVSSYDSKYSSGTLAYIDSIREHGGRTPSWCDSFLMDYKKLLDLKAEGTITEDIFDMWLASAVAKLDKCELTGSERLGLTQDFVEVSDDDGELPF